MTAPGGALPAARPALACPSAPATPGAGLLGVLGGDGRIHNLRTPMQVDEGFLQAAAAAGPPEARMRFTSACQTSACAQWTGSRCGVIDRAMAALAPPDRAELPPCTIRATCRWYDQTGAAACGTCALIVTETRIAAE